MAYDGKCLGNAGERGAFPFSSSTLAYPGEARDDWVVVGAVWGAVMAREHHIFVAYVVQQWKAHHHHYYQSALPIIFLCIFPFFSIEYIHSFLFALVQRNKMRLIICFAVCCVVKYFQLFIFLKNRGWIDFSVWIQSCFVECLGVREGDRYCRGKGAKAIQAHVCYSTPSTPRHHIVIAILPHPTPSIGALFHNFIFILFLFPFPLHYYFIPSLIICSFLILRFLLISG